MNTPQKSKSFPNEPSSGPCGTATRSKRHTRRTITILKLPGSMRMFLFQTYSQKQIDRFLTENGFFLGTMRGSLWRWVTCQSCPRKVYGKMKIASTRWSGRAYCQVGGLQNANDKDYKDSSGQKMMRRIKSGREDIRFWKNVLLRARYSYVI